jgi:ferredoxin
MRRIRLIDVNIAVVKRIFHLRFWVASWTRKSKIMNKIIKKSLFEHDGTYFIPSQKSVKNTSSQTLTLDYNVSKPDMIVMPSDIIKSVINEAEDIVIMNKCLCRNSKGCTDYPRDLGCIFLGKTTKKISRKHCREVTREEAINHIDKCSEAGLIHIMGRNKMDSVWMNVWPNEELLTICNCCPCCCLWRVYPNLSDTIQNDFYKLPGVSVHCDSDECVGCGICKDVCFADCITINEGKAKIDENICIGCGQCSNNCPTNAMKLFYENKDVQSVFNKINSLVNLKNSEK